MPKYYCDYCDIFLTHDSPSVRKAHNAGWKHKLQVQNYYSGMDPDLVQLVIDKLTAAYAGTPGAPGTLVQQYMLAGRFLHPNSTDFNAPIVFGPYGMPMMPRPFMGMGPPRPGFPPMPFPPRPGMPGMPPMGFRPMPGMPGAPPFFRPPPGGPFPPHMAGGPFPPRPPPGMFPYGPGGPGAPGGPGGPGMPPPGPGGYPHPGGPGGPPMPGAIGAPPSSYAQAGPDTNGKRPYEGEEDDSSKRFKSEQ
ncbi:U1 zinc finger-domain-containing protein [Phlyctochytrium arcticum]|nr:U1 zinc finger-domain-containing protein [Phlyctochytrium arcticum]